MRYFIGLGANLGDRLTTLRQAADRIAALGTLVARSRVFAASAVGGPPQPPFLNAAVLLECPLEPLALLAHTQEIEDAFGRDRRNEVRWGPRTLDIDIICVAGERSDDPDLTLPHPRAHERAFVLAPWHDVDPDAVLPGHGPVADLLARVDKAGVRRSDLPLVLQEAGS